MQRGESEGLPQDQYTEAHVKDGIYDGQQGDSTELLRSCHQTHLENFPIAYPAPLSAKSGLLVNSHRGSSSLIVRLS